MFDEPKIEILEVTPDLAREWLGQNEGNRNVRPTRVRAFARDIIEGRWQFNGDSIRRADDGTLLDGQHRLRAVIEAGKPIRAIVISGLPRETQDTMDAGAKRTVADQLKRHGIANSTFVASVATKMIHWDKYGRRRHLSGGTTMSNPEVIAYAADNESFLATLEVAHSYASRIKAPTSVTGLCFCVFARIDGSAAIEFFDALSTGANLPPRSPILLLRERLFDLHERVGVTASHGHYAALFCKAWNYWRTGRAMSQLKMTENESFPEPR